MKRALAITALVVLGVACSGDDGDTASTSEVPEASEPAADDDAVAEANTTTTAVATYAGEVALEAELATDVAVAADGPVWATTAGTEFNPNVASALAPWVIQRGVESDWVAEAAHGDGVAPASLAVPPPYLGTRTGGLWVHDQVAGPEGPFELWELRDGTWTDHSLDAGLPGAAGGGSMACCQLSMGPDGTVWVLGDAPGELFGDWELRRFDDSGWASVPIPEDVRGAYGGLGRFSGGPDGMLWFSVDKMFLGEPGSADLGVFDGVDWTIVPREPVTPGDDKEEIGRIVVGDDGAVWLLVTVSTDADGDGVLDPAGMAWWQRYVDGEWTAVPIDPMAATVDAECVEQFGGAGMSLDDPAARIGAMSAAVRALDVAPDGALWVATACVGASRVEPVEGTISIFGTDAGLPSTGVNALATAPDGSVWVGGYGGVTHLVPSRP